MLLCQNRLDSIIVRWHQPTTMKSLERIKGKRRHLLLSRKRLSFIALAFILMVLLLQWRILHRVTIWKDDDASSSLLSLPSNSNLPKLERSSKLSNAADRKVQVLGSAGPRLLRDSQGTCRKNAIVYLAQKVHSSYGRDSYGMLFKSLKLLQQNYLSQQHLANNTDVLIFHTGDFNNADLMVLESHLGTEFVQLVSLVDISNTSYWQRPYWNMHDNPETDWAVYPKFSEGYRRMMHFFAIDIWRFLLHYGKQERSCTSPSTSSIRSWKSKLDTSHYHGRGVELASKGILSG